MTGETSNETRRVDLRVDGDFVAGYREQGVLETLASVEFGLSGAVTPFLRPRLPASLPVVSGNLSTPYSIHFKRYIS